MLPVYNFGSLFICIVCFCPWLIGQECPFIFGPSIHIGVIVFVIHRSEPLEPDYRSTDNLQQRQSTEYFCIFSHCLEKILSYRSTVPQLSSSCLTHFCNFLIDNRIQNKRPPHFPRYIKSILSLKCFLMNSSGDGRYVSFPCRQASAIALNVNPSARSPASIIFPTSLRDTILYSLTASFSSCFSRRSSDENLARKTET